ncbi:MAG: hypothetical protein E6K90_05435 [Thaumarchaeota archaeon]|nr:MAG: hypothetical protein E6K90_05435 [Nitrososphaerota archaeon]
MRVDSIARKFMLLAVFNGLLLIPFTAPILVPTLCIATPPGSFGCQASIEIVWPGTWMLVGFFVFIIVGVLGALAWSLVYYHQWTVLEKHEGRKTLLWLQLILFEVGVLGATSLMATIGFVGGHVLATGGGIAVSAEAIRTLIIPPLSTDPSSPLYDMPPVAEAAFIGLSLLAQLLGFLNLLTLKKGAASS